MHIAAVFVIEAHLSELRAEAERNRHAKSGEPNALRKLLSAAIESLRSFSEPTTPKLQSYPYAN